MQTMENVPNFKDLNNQYPQIKGFLWDMDGTLCNTEAVHALALLKVINKWEPAQVFSQTELQDFGIGLTDTMVFEKLKNKGLFENRNIEEFLEFKNDSFLNALKSIDNQQIFHEKVRDLLIHIKDHQFKLGLVTSSERAPTELTLNKLAVTSYFDLIITQEDTAKNKPDPAPYLLAMNSLKLEKQQTLIFEDSIPGLQAAKTSGANVIQVKWY